MLLVVVAAMIFFALAAVLIMVAIGSNKTPSPGPVTPVTPANTGPAAPTGVAGPAAPTGVAGPAAPTGAVVPSPGNFPARFFAPYMWTWDGDDGRWMACPCQFVVLAFMLADKSNKGVPMWGGDEPVASKLPLVNKIRQAGKEVLVSFGGQLGTELALSPGITTVDQLAQAYISVIDALGLKWMDMDIEGGSSKDIASNTRRNQALAKVQKARPHVTLSYTLPVMPTGIVAQDLPPLQLAKQHGVRVDVVNIMTMNYGDSFKGNQGTHAINAAKATYNQLRGMGFTGTKVGICPMIGVNDTQALVFTLADAVKVRQFAQQNSWVRMLSFWALHRDFNKTGGLGVSSSIPQKEWDFSKEFSKFK